MIREVFLATQRQKKLVSVRFKWHDFDEAVVGFVKEIKEDFFELEELDKYGRVVGNSFYQFEDIYSIDMDDRYLKRLDFLYNNFNPQVGIQKQIWSNKKKIENQIIKLAKKEKIVTLYFEEESYAIGFIRELFKGSVKIQGVGNEGDEDGISFYPIDYIIGLSYDGLEEQKIQFLYQHREKFY